MKTINLYVLALLLGLAGAGDALADRGGGRGGVRLHFGWGFGPFWGPWYYPPYYPPVVVEREPPVYIEQASPPSQSAAARPETPYWYYCESTRGYYPYVRECADGWLEVSPQPPGQP